MLGRLAAERVPSVVQLLLPLEPPPPEMQQLFGAMDGNQEAMDGFVSVVSGAVSPQEFFSPHNVSRILAHDRRRLPQPA